MKFRVGNIAGGRGFEGKNKKSDAESIDPGLRRGDKEKNLPINAQIADNRADDEIDLPEEKASEDKKERDGDDAPHGPSLAGHFPIVFPGNLIERAHERDADIEQAENQQVLECRIAHGGTHGNLAVRLRQENQEGQLARDEEEGLHDRKSGDDRDNEQYHAEQDAVHDPEGLKERASDRHVTGENDCRNRDR